MENKMHPMLTADKGEIYAGKVYGLSAGVKIIDQKIDGSITENLRDFCCHCGCFNGRLKGTGRWDDVGHLRGEDCECTNCRRGPAE